MARMNRDELAGFLRGCRERVRPADVGLPDGPRRRTPGLRREEVARLAGMSGDYYTRLEQARGPRPSREMVGAIARALRLSDAELAHLHQLTGQAPDPRPGPDRDVRPGVLHLLDRLDDTPAMVCDAAYDVLAWNRMAAALLGDFGALPLPQRNVAHRFFADPDRRRLLAPDDAARFAREAVADLRATAARYPRDERVRSLVAGLRSVSTEFRELWAAHDVRVERSAHKHLDHPVVGSLELDCEALHDPERDQWVILYTAPAGSASRDALDLLRVVGTQDMQTAR